MRILGLDPGYRRFGVACATLETAGFRFDFVRVLGTEREAGPATGDMRRRMEELALELAKLCGEEDIAALCIEAGAPPFGRTQTSVLTGLGRARGLVDMLAAVMGLPVVELSPQAIKKAIAGETSADKLDVRRAMEKRHPELRAMWPKRKDDIEHAADAAAAIATGLGTGAVQNAWRARGS